MVEFQMNQEQFRQGLITVRYRNGKFAEFHKLEGVKSIKHDLEDKNKLILEKEDELILTNDEDNMVLGVLGSNYRDNKDGMYVMRTFIPYNSIQHIHWLEKKGSV